MRKRTKRKVYNLINPIAHAIEGAALVEKHRLDSLRLIELTAIEAFAKGKATLNDWQAMATMLNVCETMALEGIGGEALEACERLQTALIEAQQRYENTHRMGMTGLGLQALRDVYEYADLQRQSVDLSTFERMIAKAMKKIKSKSPGVIEL